LLSKERKEGRKKERKKGRKKESMNLDWWRYGAKLGGGGGGETVIRTSFNFPFKKKKKIRYTKEESGICKLNRFCSIIIF
jgi:mevalonate kinase